MKRVLPYIVLALLVGFGLGYYVASRPRTFADCILAHQKPGMTREAVYDVEQACAVRYPR